MPKKLSNREIAMIVSGDGELSKEALNEEFVIRVGNMIAAFDNEYASRMGMITNENLSQKARLEIQRSNLADLNKTIKELRETEASNPTQIAIDKIARAIGFELTTRTLDDLVFAVRDLVDNRDDLAKAVAANDYEDDFEDEDEAYDLLEAMGIDCPGECDCPSGQCQKIPGQLIFDSLFGTPSSQLGMPSLERSGYSLAEAKPMRAQSPLSSVIADLSPGVKLTIEVDR